MADNDEDDKVSCVKFSDGVLFYDIKNLQLLNINNKMETTFNNINNSDKEKISEEPQIDRLKLLYPNVNENEMPLPRSWSSQDKCNSIGLTQNNLRVHYKGIGKSHNDAASVRTAYPIPAACGLYYFEVKIISKGRDGYMGIGLTAQNFKMNRLPGWDKQSYGYHGDDGNSFCSSGNGQPYGPTFTTGDIIGCGVNLVDSTCFYTKNGHHLGTAFKDLPSKLYPTVGLQTPGEVVDANFGQEPFKFDIEDMIKELSSHTKHSIYSFPLPEVQGDWTAVLHKMVSSYLVHHGYSSTAETFAKITGQTYREELSSIKNRQKILKLVMSGRMGQAIEQTIRSYPGLLENNQNLLFMLKCRQFIEMVNGSDFETGSSRASPVVQTSVIQSTKAYQNGNSIGSGGGGTQHEQDQQLNNINNNNSTNNDIMIDDDVLHNNNINNNNIHNNNNNNTNQDNQEFKNNNLISNNNINFTTNNSMNITNDIDENNDDVNNSMNMALDTASTTTTPLSTVATQQITATTTTISPSSSTTTSTDNNIIIYDDDIDSNNDIVMQNGFLITNGNSNNNNNNYKNGLEENNITTICDTTTALDTYEDMDVDPIPSRKTTSKSGVERMLEFGRELFQMSQRLEKENGANEKNQKMLEDAFSLLAYSNPWASPLGWQLCPTRRESVCAALNSAILESMNFTWRPPLEICIAHACELLHLMASSSLGACAFASVEDVLQH